MHFHTVLSGGPDDAANSDGQHMMLNYLLKDSDFVYLFI